jgi:zinc protease
MMDQRNDVSAGRASEVDHDVGVDVGNLRVANAKSLESALVDKPAGTDALDFLEDRACTGMPFEPRMSSAAPAQVFLHDAVHDVGILPLELERRGEREILSMMEDRVVVPEVDVLPIDCLSLAFLREQFSRFEHLGDEHCSLALGCGREKMKILPDGAANGAWNADVMFESRPTKTNSFRNDLRHYRAAFNPQPPVVAKVVMRRDISNHKAANALVGDEDVRAKTEHEVRNLQAAGGYDCVSQRIRAVRLVQKICRPADLEGGKGRKRHIALEVDASERGRGIFERSRRNRRPELGGWKLGHWPGKEIMSAGQSLPRHTLLRTTLAVVIAVVSIALPLHAQRAELEKRIRREILSNGLEVIVVENHGVPLATIEADAKNGSFTQSATYEGLSHLYEHMFFKANAKYAQPEAFVNRASELGAVFNGTTQEEQVNYYLTVPSDSTMPALALLSTALQSPLFLKDELERERAVVIGEYDRAESDPGYALQTAVGKALWGTAWSRKNPLGERKVILATTPEQMRTIQRKYYVPNNTAIIVTGDVIADSIFMAARRLFGDWPRAADPFKVDTIPPVPPLTQNVGVIVEQPVNSVVVMMRWHGPGAHSDIPATYAADVFSDVLNQPGSRFQRKLVDSGLWQSLGVNYYTLNQVGPITINGEVAPGKLREAIAALDRELIEVVKPGYITTEAVDGVKRTRIVGTMESLERASGFAHQVGFWWAVTGLDYFFGYVDTMARQTPEDLRRYAARYIVGKPRVTGVLISPETRRALKLTESELTGGTP